MMTFLLFKKKRFFRWTDSPSPRGALPP